MRFPGCLGKCGAATKPIGRRIQDSPDTPVVRIVVTKDFLELGARQAVGLQRSRRVRVHCRTQRLTIMPDPLIRNRDSL